MAVYASRPLTTIDYLAARAASLATVVFGFLYLPHLVLFLGRAWVSDDGFFSYLTGNLEILWQTALGSVVYFVAFASLGLLIASFASRSSIAAGVLLGLVTISGPTTAALVDSETLDSAGLLALQHHPGYVKDWIMDAGVHRWIPERAGFEPVASLAMIIVIAVVAAIVVAERYRRLR
jgi:ABC-2 type transport system permease protein